MYVLVSELWQDGRRVGLAVKDTLDDGLSARVLDDGDTLLCGLGAERTFSRAQLVELGVLAEVWQGLARDLVNEWMFEEEQDHANPADLCGRVRVHREPRVRDGLLEWAAVGTATGNLVAVVLRLASGLDALLLKERVCIASSISEQDLHRFAARGRLPLFGQLTMDTFEFLAEVAGVASASSRPR